MRRRLPPLISLRYFEAAARHLSFTKAADELCVTQAAVSHQIKALEEWLGVPLFVRLNRAIKLTDSGQKFSGPLTEAFDILENVTSEVLLREIDSALTIATFDSIASAWLVPRLKGLRALYPELNVHIRIIDKYSDFIDDDIDLEIRYGDGNWPKFHVTKLAEEDLYPVCSPQFLDVRSPLRNPSDLLKYKLIHDETMTSWQQWLIAAGVSNPQLDDSLSMNHSHLVMQAAIAGEGIALGRSVLVQDALKNGSLIIPLEYSLKSDFAYYIVCPKNTAEQIWVSSFREWLESEVAQSQQPIPATASS